MERIKRLSIYFILLLIFPMWVYAATELNTSTQYPIVGSSVYVQLDLTYCTEKVEEKCFLPQYMIRDFHTIIDYDPSFFKFDTIYWSQSSGSYSTDEYGTIKIDKEKDTDWRSGPALQMKFTVLRSGQSTIKIRRNGESHYADGNIIGQSFGTLTITSKEPSSSVLLSGLYVSDFEIQPTFSNMRNDYTLSVASSVSSVYVVAQKGDKNQTILNDGKHDLVYGDNKIHIIVKAQDGTTNTYTINVVRTDDRSGDTTLKTITVGDEIINVKPDVYDYETIVTRSMDTVLLNARTTDPYATLMGTGKKSLNIGSNQFTLTVEGANGRKQNYTININRSPEEFEVIENSKKLKSIKANGVSLDLSNEQVRWFYGVDAESDSLNITTVTESKTAVVDIKGNENFKPGINIVEVKVTEMKNVLEDQEPTENDYTIYTIVVYKNPEDTLLISTLDEIPEDSDLFYRTTSEKDSIIGGNIFSTLKKKDKKLYYNLVNSYNGLLYQAIITGDISDKELDISFGLVEGNHYATKLPKDVDIMLNVSELYEDGRDVKIYTYTKEGEYTLLTDGLTVQNGYVKFKTNGDTDYVITTVELIRNEGPFRRWINKYKNLIIGIFAGIVLVALIVYVISKKAKGNNPNEPLY